MALVQPPLRRVTSTDVARAVGLSRTTVSYVLNETPGQKIPEDTRRRVLDAAASLGYAPSAAARTLRSGRSDVVLCLLPDWPIGVVLGRLLESMSLELGRRGLTLLTHPGTGQQRPVSHVLSAVTPAAVVSFEPLSKDEQAVIRAAAISVALVLGDPRGRSRVRSLDQRLVGRMQVEHLVATGHRILGYAVPDDPRLDDFAEPRMDGVRKACLDLGLADPIVRTVALESAQAATAVADWVNSDPAVTAVCAYNDEVAFAVLAGMRLQGMWAPAHLAVIGVDDIPTATVADPPLTTVRMDEAVEGLYIANCVVAALAGKPMPRNPGPNAIQLRRRETA
jgi:DNA-binding LacI/PurR family transcriptional regulator